MKKIKAALFFTMMASIFCFISCSDNDSETYYETPSVELPESVGENPFVREYM